MLRTMGNFRDRQMTPEDFAAYMRRMGTQHTHSVASCSTPSKTKLVVTGYSGEVGAVIKATCGNDTLTVDWHSHDSTVSERMCLNLYKIQANANC